jgi:hypothetical protein
MVIRGPEGLSIEDMLSDAERGGRFVVYTWTVSVVLMTFRRPSDVHFVPAGRSRVATGLRYSLASLALGWWGIPWGPIATVGSIVANSCGGKDVTDAIFGELRQQVPRRRA